jgi:PAS domain S-box-containing protein
MEEGVPLACGCPPGPAWHGLVDPTSDLLLALDDGNAIAGGFPHESLLASDVVCGGGALERLFPLEVARLLRSGADQVRRSGAPMSIDLYEPSARVRIAAHGDGVWLLLRRVETDAAFWQLFEAAPLPLAIEIATSETAPAWTRPNRRFIELFGYSREEVPTVQHWWPLAYPDPAYRDRVRDEWFRRITRATEEQAAIEPMQTMVQCKDGSTREIEFFAAAIGERHVVIFVDHTERNRTQRALDQARAEAIALRELLPLCAWCHRLRDQQGSWRMLEEFIRRETGATVTHGICDECRSRNFAR